MLNDKDESMESSIEEEIDFPNVCSVCGYEKGKNNYGAFTCSSCKIFFRRNANLDLNKNKCKYQGQCQINLKNRKTCRICRINKCLAVGMSKDLFRPSYTIYSSNKHQNKKEDNKSMNKNFQLRFDEELILLNLIDNYELCSPISDIIEMIKNSSNNPTKIRLKIDKNNLIVIENKFYLSIISFIKLNNKFNSLSKNDQRLLIKRNVHNLSELNRLFIYNEIDFLNDPFEISCILDEYGSLYLDYLLKTIVKIPSDNKIMKLFLIILTFSTSSDQIDFNFNQFCEEENNLSNSLNLLNIQNIYVEILFKYLINHFGYQQSIKQFQNLIEIILTQISLNNTKHYQTLQIILNQIEEDYQ